MTLKIAVYVPIRHAHSRFYKRDNFNNRVWKGLSVVLDVMKRAGIEYEYAGKETIHLYDIALVSITAPIDYFYYIREWTYWKTPRPITILGGAGVMNVRPVLPAGDISILGRAEDLIIPVIEGIKKGLAHESKSVIYHEAFDPDLRYYINQAPELYPHRIHSHREKGYDSEWTEQSIGCPNKCLFCSYTWHRKHLKSAAMIAAGSGEFPEWEDTIKEVVKADEIPKRLTLVGLDGVSERLRRAVNKPIKRGEFRRFLELIATREKPRKTRVFSIIGYPTEGPEDINELLEDLALSQDVHPPRSRPMPMVSLRFLPFRPMPGTPLAIWPAAQPEQLDQYHQIDLPKPRNIYTVVEYLESFTTSIIPLLILRGVEYDWETIQRLSLTPQAWTGKLFKRKRLIEKHVEIDRLIRRYAWEELPTRYIRTYIRPDIMQKAEAKATRYLETGVYHADYTD